MNGTTEYIYNYLTDFVINLANILNLSYYEINLFIFCFTYPIFPVLIILCIIQRKRLKWLELKFKQK